MTDPTSPNPRPAPWAIALLVVSTLLALVVVALVASGFVLA